MTAETEVSVNPLAVWCEYCGAWRDLYCTTASGKTCEPHIARWKLATVLEGHADPALDEYFPRIGPCGLCGVPGLDQRHRVIDAIAGRLAAGEGLEEAADDYGLTVEAVQCVEAWAQQWPGAWG